MGCPRAFQVWLQPFCSPDQKMKNEIAKENMGQSSLPTIPLPPNSSIHVDMGRSVNRASMVWKRAVQRANWNRWQRIACINAFPPIAHGLPIRVAYALIAGFGLSLFWVFFCEILAFACHCWLLKHSLTRARVFLLIILVNPEVLWAWSQSTTHSQNAKEKHWRRKHRQLQQEPKIIQS